MIPADRDTPANQGTLPTTPGTMSAASLWPCILPGLARIPREE